jgi:hypothetical protein
LSAVVELVALEVKLPLSEVYDKVSFGQAAEG